MDFNEACLHDFKNLIGIALDLQMDFSLYPEFSLFGNVISLRLLNILILLFENSMVEKLHIRAEKES